MSEVTVIDYGAGNLASITAGLGRLGAEPRVSDDPAQIAGARRLVLPGVGAAGPAMAELRRRGLTDAIATAVADGAALLGICLGMQLLFERSREGDAGCLGLLPGETVAIDWSTDCRTWAGTTSIAVSDHPLAGALPSICYFAHSYVVAPERARGGGRHAPSSTAAASPAWSPTGRVAGAQFHPEKSGAAGRAMLEALARLGADAA